MDISMPIMNGYEATTLIRSFEKKKEIAHSRIAYIVGLTAHATAVYKDQCYKSGMNDYCKFIYFYN